MDVANNNGAVSVTAPSNSIDDFISDRLIPRWASSGWDEKLGGLHEGLAVTGEPVVHNYRRLTVAARQLYTFSRAAQDFNHGDAAAMAHQCFEYLLTKFQDAEHAGWFFKVSMDGQPLDTKKDLYASAFVVLGLTAYYSAFGDNEAARVAEETLATLADKLSIKNEWLALSARRDWADADARLHQNPHMHLLEAAILLNEKAPSEVARSVIQLISALYENRLADPRTGCLTEFFDANGMPDKAAGHILEPGHHYEWYWIISQLPSALGLNGGAARVRTMFDWARQSGCDRQHGGIYDQVDWRGTPLKSTKRIWPLTEAAKAYAAAISNEGAGELLGEFQATLGFLFDKYLRPDGTWVESLNKDLSPAQTWMPATTCYHLYLGLSEARDFIKNVNSAKLGAPSL
jgi:mannose-6-phosphate isomerase